MGGDFFSNFLKEGGFVNEFGKLCIRSLLKAFMFQTFVQVK